MEFQLGAGCWMLWGGAALHTGYFWPRNLSGVSRPCTSKLLGEGGAGLCWSHIPAPGNSQTVWGKTLKSAKNAIFNQELNVCSKGNLLLLNLFSSRFPLLRGWNSIILLLLGCTEQGPSGCGSEQAGEGWNLLLWRASAWNN